MSNYKAVETMLANSDYFLFKSMIDAVCFHLENANKELARLENIDTFETLEQYDNNKAAIDDIEYEIATLKSLLNELKETEETLIYNDKMRW